VAKKKKAVAMRPTDLTYTTGLDLLEKYIRDYLGGRPDISDITFMGNRGELGWKARVNPELRRIWRLLPPAARLVAAVLASQLVREHSE
jgi:hypothetical protein